MFKTLPSSTVICDKGIKNEVPPQNIFEIKSSLIGNETKIIGRSVYFEPFKCDF